MTIPDPLKRTRSSVGIETFLKMGFRSTRHLVRTIVYLVNRIKSPLPKNNDNYLATVER